eukprot:scaffold41918_cov45-Attheya_sp.AAC.3
MMKQKGQVCIRVGYRPDEEFTNPSMVGDLSLCSYNFLTDRPRRAHSDDSRHLLLLLRSLRSVASN